MRLLGPIVLAAAMLGVAACSSDGEAAEATSTIEASPASTVQAFLDEAGIEVDETEAGCVAQALDSASLDAMAAAGDDAVDLADEASLDLYDALVRCEPEGYVAAQAGSITNISDATDEQARCVIHAANALIARDPAMLAVAAKVGSTKDWPEAEKARLREAVLTCVPAEIADDIVDS